MKKTDFRTWRKPYVRIWRDTLPVLLLGAATLLLACKTESGGTADPPTSVKTVFEAPQEDLDSLPYNPSFQPDYNNLTAQPWVEPATPEQTNDVDVFADRLEFPVSHAEVLTWQPGRLVVAGPGKGAGKNGLGFARRVTTVETVGSKIVVKTGAPAIEEILQGDFQLVLDPNKGTDVDLSKVDAQWVTDNLYANDPDVDAMPGELLTDDYPPDIAPMGFFSKIKKAITKAATSIAKVAKNVYLAVTPSTLSVSGSIAPEIKFGSKNSLAVFDYKKTFKTKGDNDVELALKAEYSYDANVSLKPGVQVGAKIGVPGHGASSQVWLNFDGRVQAQLVEDLNLDASLRSVNGRTASEIESYLNGQTERAQEVYNTLREKLLGDPDTKPSGTWKTTLWISKPAYQTLSAGPVPVVLTQTLQVDLECGFEVKGSIKSHFELSQSATMKFAVKYDTGTNKVTFDTPTFDKRHVHAASILGQGSLMATCGLIPRVNVFLYDTVGIFAGVRGSLVGEASYATECDPASFWPTGKVGLKVSANVGIQGGGRLQAPGSSFVGKQGQKAGFDVGPVEPWNKNFTLWEKEYSFKRGFGWCMTTCFNKTRDDSETDVDCGGDCAPCAVGKQCALNSDCLASSCNNETCTPSTCGNKVQDGQETDIDCGGPSCGACANSRRCEAGTDCTSGFCGGKASVLAGVCLSNHCGDAVRDADEGGIDCAGADCPKCGTGVVVGSATSCVSSLWDGRACVASTCNDGLKGGDESDRDCGGSCAFRCRLLQGCRTGADCAQGLDCHGSQRVCLRKDRTSCAANGQCLSGLCVNNSCKALPASCQAILQDTPGAADGAYGLFVGGDTAKPWTAYCKDMATAPKEYLTLVNTTNVNFSQYTAGGATAGTNVRTAYQKVRLDPATLKVDATDQTYSTSTGTATRDGGTYTAMPYGSAADCVTNGSATGVGNIDLQGTPFSVAADQFAVNGFMAAGMTTYGAANRTVDLTGGGFCGWNTVKGGPIPLNQTGGPIQLQYLP